MNRRTLFEIAALGTCAATVGNVVGGHASPMTRDVEAVVEDLRLAMLDGREKVLNKVLSPHCSWGHSNGVVQTRAEFVDAVSSRSEVFETLAFEGRTAMATGDMGVARHTFVSDLTIDGRPLTVRLGELQVWARENGSLRCLARQAYAL